MTAWPMSSCWQAGERRCHLWLLCVRLRSAVVACMKGGRVCSVRCAVCATKPWSTCVTSTPLASPCPAFQPDLPPPLLPLLIPTHLIPSPFEPPGAFPSPFLFLPPFFFYTPNPSRPNTPKCNPPPLDLLFDPDPPPPLAPPLLHPNFIPLSCCLNPHPPHTLLIPTCLTPPHRSGLQR